MNENILIEGAKTGLEIAIRRNDLNLLKTCFDILWSSKATSASRNWLRWRIRTIVMESAIHMMGEYAAFANRMIDKQIVVNSKEDERAHRAFLYKLAVSWKNPDAVALQGLCRMQNETPKENCICDLEFSKSWWWLRYADEHGLVEAADNLYKYLTHEVWPPGFWNVTDTDYKRHAVSILKGLVTSAGPQRERETALVGMILHGRRLFLQEIVAARWQQRIEEFLKAPDIQKPKIVELPWYVYDPHTSVGSRVLDAFKRKREIVSVMWRTCETLKIPKNAMQIEPVSHKTNPDNGESIWWLSYLKRVLVSTGMSAREALLEWKENYAQKVEKLVKKELKR